MLRRVDPVAHERPDADACVPASRGCIGGAGTFGAALFVAARGVVSKPPRGDRSARCLRLIGAGATMLRGVVAIGPVASRPLSMPGHSCRRRRPACNPSAATSRRSAIIGGKPQKG